MQQEHIKKLSRNKILLLLSIIGPGIITASVDNDPGGITTYTLAGSQYGFLLLWTLIPIVISLILIQEMAARMGIASGKGLADLIREYLGLKTTFYIMLVLIIVNFGNVLSQFAGIAAAGELFGISKYILIPICATCILFLIIYANYKIVERVFLISSLLYICYIVSGLMSNPPWAEVTKELVTPHFIFEEGYFALIVGLIGTTIAPWMMFYLQSSIVEKGIKPADLKYSKIDVISGSIITATIAFFIIVASAVTLYENGIIVESAGEAAKALAPFAGIYAAYLFAFGLFNAGMFSAAILPLSTAYSICEGMGWESGVSKKFKMAPHFYLIIIFLVVSGSALIMIPNFPLIQIMVISQILNGILLPFILIYMLRLSNSARVMGKYRNTKTFNIITWTICIIIIILTLFLIYYSIF